MARSSQKPSLFDGVYQGGYVSLVEVYDFCEAASSQVGLEEKVARLTDLHRVVGQVRLIPLLPKGEEDEAFASSSGSIDLVEEDGRRNPFLLDVPLVFLRNVPGTSLLPVPETETMLTDGPIKVGEDVWLKSRNRISYEVVNGEGVSSERQVELRHEAVAVEDLREAFPSGRYTLLGIETREKGVYCRIQTLYQEEVTILSDFLVPCNRPPRERFRI